MEDMDMSGPLELRRRQAEAIDAAVFALETPPGGTPEGGLRTQVIAAPGSGKTLVAYEVARRLEPRGRVLVLVPTLNLLTQTVAKWRQYGMRQNAVAVCSLDRDPEMRAYLADELDVRCTTNPLRLAMWAGTGPATIFATYASLVGNPGRRSADEDEEDEEDVEAVEERAVAGVLERALAGAFGQKLEGFGLAIVDEAHRTAGLATKPWAIVHDNTRIPADRRLYMTATPRIWEADDTDGEVLVASMDDEALYGKPAFTYPLGQAIEEGTLASFEIDVLEIRDPTPPGDDATLEERRGARLGAIRAATLAHMETAGVVSLLSFHARTQEALSFARGLPDAADELRATGRFPGEVWGEWLCGLHPAAHQRAVLNQIAGGVDTEGRKTEFRILSTCRLLGEGTDITGRCGLDGVLFADVRSSPVDIVQAVGRALRQKPAEGKVARLVVPVLLASEDEGRDMAATAAFEPLVTVLRALRAFDPRVVEHLALRPAGRSGTPEDILAADPAGDPRQADTPTKGNEPADEDHDREEETDGGEGAELALLHFSRRPREAEEIARLVRTRVLRPEATAWLTGLEAVRAFAAEHGHANIPYTATVDLGDHNVAYPAGQWAAEQRRAWRHGDLADWRTELLAEEGFVFDPRDQAFTEFLDVCALYFAEHHTLAAPRDAVIAGAAVGERLHQARKPGGLGKKSARAEARRERLEAIDRDWNPAWSLSWQRHYAKARWLISQGATLTELQPGVSLGGDDIGTWLAEQPAAWHTLTDGQQQRLATLGVRPAAPAALPAAPAVSAGASRWEINLAAARQFKTREGHLRVPRGHIETITDTEGREHQIRLGVFRSNTRTHHKKQKLTPDQTHEAHETGLLS